MFIFYARDNEGYARGAVRTAVSVSSRSILEPNKPESRAARFVEFFLRVHAQHQFVNGSKVNF